MNDMRAAITPKSDQLNADDLLAGSITITVRQVTIRSTPEQPVSIHYENDGGKPYKPCKSMSRVLVHAWGADANNYIGRSMTLYCDPNVKWAGMKVGGIRISHLSDIKGDIVMPLTETKGQKKPFQVKPLKESARKADAPSAGGAGVTGPQTATQAQSPLDPTKPPVIIHVPQLADGKGADWIGWLKLMGAAIDAAPSVEWLNGLVTENQAAIGGLRDASDKQYSALMTKIEGRRQVLKGSPPLV